MHATLLTVLLLAGGQPPALVDQHQPTMATEDCPRTNCNRWDCGVGCRSWSLLRGCLVACCGSIPQTCCTPRCGRCRGNDRCIHCYPAFRASYNCCQAYDYRRQSDYPWHAAAHAPRAFFTSQSHRPPAVEVVPTPYPDPESVPLAPLPRAPLPPASDSP